MAQHNTEVRRSWLSFFRSEIVLGTMVALLSVLTAAAAYQGSISDSKESDANVEAQKILSLSNTEFLRANQDIIQDYTMYDGYYINFEKDADLTEYYKDSFSDSLITSMDRTDGPFDDQYYTEMYKDADESYEEAMNKFDEAQSAGDKADRYQLTLMIFAVGLALSAWASIVNEASKLRPAFAIISIATSIFGVILFVQLLATA